jgi:hypothetical protein
MAIAQLIGDEPLQLSLVGLQHCLRESFHGCIDCGLFTRLCHHRSSITVFARSGI